MDSANAPVPAVDQDAFSVWLDCFRWVAAVVVLIAHAGGDLLTSVDGRARTLQALPHYAYSMIAGFAHYAVIVFFVLSGYLVGGSFCSSVFRGRLNLSSYFIRRLTRLWIVLVPSLVLTVIFRELGLAIWPDAINTVYAGGASSTINIRDFTCNAAFLQNVFCSRFGGNESLWSLFNEFWYYVFFPPICLLLLRKTSILRIALAFGAVLMCICLTVIQNVHAPLGPYFLIWGLGVGVALLRRRPFLKRPLAALSVFGFAATACRLIGGKQTWETASLPGFCIDLFLGLLFAQVLLSFKFRCDLRPPAMGRLHTIMASFSFSLYCIHLPFLMLCSCVSLRMLGTGWHMIPKSALEWGVVLTCLTATLLAAWVLSLMTERHTDRLRLQVVRALQTVWPSPRP